MNKLTKLIIAIAMSFTVPLPSLAHDFEVDGIYYNYLDKTAKTVEVTFKGSYWSEYSNEYSGCITIPSSVTYSGTTYSVNSIGDMAFYLSNGLISITIPNSVTSIGDLAFASCNSLTELNYNAENCTSIGSALFSGCNVLTTLNIGNNVKTVPSFAFSGLSSLTSATIGNSVTTIGEHAFSKCTGLTEVTIPNSVTSIGGVAFLGCTGLTSVTIGNSVATIGSGAFSECAGLTSVNYNAENCMSMNTDVFRKCNALTNLNIGNNVKTIPSHAFYECTSLNSITIGNSVTTIGERAFYKCTGLTSITISNSVTTIGDYAFAYCTGMTSVTIGNAVTTIGMGAFSECTGLTSVIFGSSVAEIGMHAFLKCQGILTMISLNPTPPSWNGNYFTVVSNFVENFNSRTLYVPKNSYDKYSADNVWGAISNIKTKIDTQVSSIALNKTTLTINSGSDYTLNANTSPSNATIPNLTWESDNSTIATVDQGGKVIGISAGTATITVRANDGSNVSATCKVTVKSVTPIITLSQTVAMLPVNSLLTLRYSITNSSTKTVTWSTSDASVASVKTNSDGSASIVGMADGVSTITATLVDNGKKYTASCVVAVGEAGVEDIETDNNAVEVVRYDIHGRLLSEPTPGINIVKMSNGTTRKEIVK